MSDEHTDDSQATGELNLGGDTQERKDRFEGERLANRYLLEKLLDRGGFGGVYKGVDSRFDSQVAIKLLTPPFSDNEFRREAKLARRFRHPNVVEVYDYGIDRGLAYIVMEYLRGDRVDQLLHARFNRLFPPELLDKFVHEITSALQNAHEQDLVHRDLKPQNVMLIEEGKPTERFMLLDFGIAAQTTAKATTTLRNATRDTAFTPNYGAPERFTGEEADQRTDVYSFGVILYELITGMLPFYDERLLILMQAVQNNPPPPFSDVAPHLKGYEQLETLVMRCLEKAPIDRPQSMEEVREEYFEARQSQLANPTDRARFVDQWKRDTSKASTTEWHLGEAGETSPTIDIPDTSDVTATDTDRDQPTKEEQLTAAQRELQQTMTVHRRRMLLTILGAVGATVAAIAVSVVAFYKPEPPPKIIVPWKPSDDFGPVEGAQLHPKMVNGEQVYDRIQRIVPGVEKPVVFILIDDEHSPSKPFYIMETEVWNGLFRQFANSNGKIIVRDDQAPSGIWEEGAAIKGESQGVGDPQLPVVNVTVTEAHNFALALLGDKGRLPTVDEWNTAAGYYHWRGLSKEERAKLEGPFNNSWPEDDTSDKPDIAVDGRGPLPVGTAADDVSKPYGCRDMAGNVTELTCDLEGSEERVPLEKQNRFAFVKVRGENYADRSPFRYEDTSEAGNILYDEQGPYYGFRVVIEIK